MVYPTIVNELIESLVDKEYLEEFTKLFEEDYPDHDLTPQEIFDKALELLRIVRLVARPIPKDQEAEYQEVLRSVKEAQGIVVDSAKQYGEIVSNGIPALELRKEKQAIRSVLLLIILDSCQPKNVRLLLRV